MQTACHEKLKQTKKDSSASLLFILPLLYHGHFFHLPYHTLSWLLLCSACKNPLPREGVLTQNVNLWNDVRCDRCWWNGQGRLISVTSSKLLWLSLQNHVVIMDFYHLCVSKFTEFFTLFINLELHHFTRRKDSMCVCVFLFWIF